MLLLLSACKGENNSPQETTIINTPPTDTADPNTPLYPFTDYIRRQVMYVDTTPFGIEKTVEINGKTISSAFLTKDDFKQMAGSFLEIDPNTTALKPQYTETSFKDLSINRITFSIETKNAGLPLQRADILLNADNQQVKNVLLRKQLISADSTVLQHLLWVDKMHFQISEIVTRKDKTEYTRVTRVVWDKPLE